MVSFLPQLNSRVVLLKSAIERACQSHSTGVANIYDLIHTFSLEVVFLLGFQEDPNSLATGILHPILHDLVESNVAFIFNALIPILRVRKKWLLPGQLSAGVRWAPRFVVCKTFAR